MTAVKAGDVEAALRRRDPSVDIVLVYGPDAGLVAERARGAAEGAVDDPSDHFQLVRLDGETVAADPGRLADEAGTIGLFSARRAIWVRPTSRPIASAVDAVLRGPPLQETLIVLEAGDLNRTAPVRTLCERSPRALALPCYADSERDLARLVDETLKAARLAIGREARAALLGSLGGDRLATRAELAKLLLYVEGAREITLDDVEAVLSDVSSLALDAVIDAAFAGDRAMLQAGYRRLRAEGVPPSTVIGGALRHALALLPARSEVEAGRAVASVVEGWRGLHFRRRALVGRHLERWRADALRSALRRLHSDVLATRQTPELADAIASRALFDLAAQRARAAAPSD